MNRAQYTPSAAFWSDVQGIIGLGTYPQEDDDTWSFINNAYVNGLIQANAYSFQGVNGDADYAHLTIGGYNYEDMASDIEWFNITETGGWKVPISDMIMNNNVNLLTAPSDDDAADQYLGADAVSVIPSYAHFNTGYPFIGVDSNTGAMVEADL